MSTNHSKRGSNRAAALQRRTTKGPLDEEDPLAPSRSLTASPADPLASPLAISTELGDSLNVPLTRSEEKGRALSTTPTNNTKDLSFLLDASIYHPISNIDVPAPYRKSLPPAPLPNTPLTQIFPQLATYVKECDFLSAAYLAAATLTTGLVQPSDVISIFNLLSIRYSALELSGNVMLAAQESKALEDLSSSFYYDEGPRLDNPAEPLEHSKSHAKHIMPFDLRLQALRLQGIGFGDSRRAVGALFDLGMECRDNIARAGDVEAEIWKDRLNEVGVRVVNALIDMGDLDCASRTLKSMKPEGESASIAWTSRIILLLVKMGEINEARNLFQNSKASVIDKAILQSFIEIADGNYENAVKTLSQLPPEDADRTSLAVAKQNLAVAYLYTGEIGRSRNVLEDLIAQGYSFQALTINLATLYDLTSDRSKDMKLALANKIANTTTSQPQRGFVNADFKL